MDLFSEVDPREFGKIMAYLVAASPLIFMGVVTILAHRRRRREGKQ